MSNLPAGTNPEQPDMLTEALELAATGFHIVPIQPGKKHPAMKAWQNAATRNADTIRNWWTGLYRNHGIGIATGYDGLFVIDLDMHGDTNGIQTWIDLCDQHPELNMDTVMAVTGTGGMHIYFRAPEGTEIRNDAGRRLGPGIDIRGIGGQVLAPPTLHPNRIPYAWIEGHTPHDKTVVDAHPILLQLIATQPDTPTKPAPPVTTDTDDSPAAWFNNNTTWPQLLERDGWTHTRTDPSGEQHWTRPGKNSREGTSATVGYKGADVFVCFTSSVPELDPNRAYSRFGYEAATRHHGDRSAAARHIRTLMPTNGTPAHTTNPNPAAPATADPAIASDWERLDAAHIAQQILDGTINPETPDIGHIPNTAGLIYRGRINQIFGESGGGKTWIALHLIAETLQRGEHTLLIDYEDSLLGTVTRLLNLGVTIQQLALLDYRNPDTSIGHATEHLDHTHNYTLIVIDSTGESLAAGGVDDVDAEVARWFALVRQTLNLPGNPAILLIDHIAKSKDANPLYAIGSQRKRAAVTGAAYRVDTVIPFAQNRNGIIKLTVAKDRLGTRPRGTVACEAHIISNQGTVNITLQLSDAQQAAAAGRPFRPTILMERVSRHIEDNPGCNWNQIRHQVTGNVKHLSDALKLLCDEGYVHVGNGPRNALLNTSIKPYREHQDLEQTP